MTTTLPAWQFIVFPFWRLTCRTLLGSPCPSYSTEVNVSERDTTADWQTLMKLEHLWDSRTILLIIKTSKTEHWDWCLDRYSGFTKVALVSLDRWVTHAMHVVKTWQDSRTWHDRLTICSGLLATKVIALLYCLSSWAHEAGQRNLSSDWIFNLCLSDSSYRVLLMHTLFHVGCNDSVATYIAEVCLPKKSEAWADLRLL